MFDSGVQVARRQPLPDVVEHLRSLPVAGDDAARVAQLEHLEELKRAACAAQARITVELVASQRAAQVAAGVRSDRAHRGVVEQVALARGESPSQGSRFVGMATALVHEMPRTMQALAAGRISEWTATCVVRETAVLQVEHRTAVDTRLGPVLARPGESTGRLTRAAKELAQQLDAEAVVRRAAKAENERAVTIRPAPDTMVYVTALLPVVEGVACIAALRQAAASATAAGDLRGRGQVMADTLVARLTGRDPVTAPVEVHVDLVMTDSTFLAGGRAPARVTGRGQAPVPVPGVIARRLVAAAGAAGRVWLRRLFTSPDGSALVAMDSRARRFPAQLARLVEVGDQTCRTPWCDAPVAHTDHVRSHAAGGPTERDNAQGLCRRCNHAKQAPGWSARREPDGTVRTTTPIGRTYTGSSPPLPGQLAEPAPDAAGGIVVELHHAPSAWHRRTA